MVELKDLLNQEWDEKKLTKQQKNYLKEIQRRINLVESANIHNPEAVLMWQSVKDLSYIRPDIREKWEKALKNSNINI